MILQYHIAHISFLKFVVKIVKTVNAIYYKSSDKNFGDDLNLVLWPTLLPDYHFAFHNHDNAAELDALGTAEVIIYFIGTVLDQRVVKSVPKIIFGSGVGYGSRPNIDDSWDVFFVREIGRASCRERV